MRERAQPDYRDRPAVLHPEGDDRAGAGPTVLLVTIGHLYEVAHLAWALMAAGCRPVVLTRDDGLPAAPELSGLAVIRVPAGPVAPLPRAEVRDHLGDFVYGLGQAVAVVRPDIVHSVGWLAGASARLAGRSVPRVHSCDTVSAAEFGPYPEASRADLLRLERATVGAAHRVLTAGPAASARVRRLGVPQGGITIIPPGVDRAVFRPHGPADERGAARRLILVSPRPERFPVCRVLAGLPETELVLMGVGDEPGADAVLRSAAEHGRRDRVRVVTPAGAAHRAAVLRSADLVLCLGHAGWLPGAPIEALACGVPVVACCAESADAVSDGLTGMHAVGERPGDLTRKLLRLLSDPVGLESMSIAAADRAASRHDWRRVGDETVRVYDEVVTAADRGGSPAPAPRGSLACSGTPGGLP